MLRAALILVFALSAGAVLACSADVVELKSDDGKFQFRVDVADTDATRAQGLMHVERMAQFTGMLFVYDTPVRAAFWMKNTLIPLDMVFADETGLVMQVHENAVPHSEATIDGGENVKLVLEINGGLASKLGLEAGVVMRHPAIDQAQAAWACE